jgi:predicted amidohydrolase YtcJ
MPTLTRRRVAAYCSMAFMAAAQLPAQEPAADLLLINGKVVTVDERFTIAEAIAVAGEEIVAVGDNDDITAFSGPGTRTIDLEGLTVIPGLIDNHMHLLRAGATWLREVRLDGIGSRRRALEMLHEKAEATPSGEWIATLGGWTADQFGDDDRPLTREELDAAAPDHPVLLQASYYRAYLNSRALEAFGLEDASAPAWAVRGADRRLTGEVEEAGIRTVAARLPAPSTAEIEAGTAAMIADLNAAGITAVGSAGCPEDLLELYRAWADQGRLGLRVFCITGLGASTPAQVDRIVPRIADIRVFQGDRWIDHIAYGEGVYGPLHDPMFARTEPRREDLDQWHRIVAAIARAGLPLHVHANFRATIHAFLDEIERVHRDVPVRNLRWVFAHANELDAAHIARMKALGMYAAVHPWAVINSGINRDVFGEDALRMPPLREIEDSGITWGFGSDGSRANQVLPFTTLAWAVSGHMVGGERALSETINREEALIAHTRMNAYLIFQEDRLGSIEPGKLADLVVLDRDYLSVPAEDIQNIRPVMTIVGGRIVHDVAE